MRLGSAFALPKRMFCISATFFFLFEPKYLTFSMNSARYALFTDPQISLFSNFFIKNGSHGTIHIFKNYFAIVFFSFQLYPNGPEVELSFIYLQIGVHISCFTIQLIILLWNVYIKVMKLSCLLFTFKLESIFLALLSNLTIFSGQSFLIACLSMNQGDISALTSSGIFERRLVSWFIITQVLFHI